MISFAKKGEKRKITNKRLIFEEVRNGLWERKREIRYKVNIHIPKEKENK